jgi:hypothetical protein
MNKMMKYHCSNCCSVCLCTPSLTQTTTGLQAAILPPIPLPAHRANALVEHEHPKFGNTGLSASDDHSANVTFKERPPWAQMSTFSRQTLAPLITSDPSMPGPGDGTLAMADISNFTTTKIVDKRPGRSGVEYKCKFGPLWLAARLVGTAQMGHVYIQTYENELVRARRLGILRKRK